MPSPLHLNTNLLVTNTTSGNDIPFRHERPGLNTTFKMSQRVVLITGCSTGIGYALAILLAKDPNKSFKVYATMRNLEKRVQLEETAGECLETTLFIEELDVCSDTSVTELVDKLIAREGRIDILGKTVRRLDIN